MPALGRWGQEDEEFKDILWESEEALTSRKISTGEAWHGILTLKEEQSGRGDSLGYVTLKEE